MDDRDKLPEADPRTVDRRRFLGYFGAVGLGGTLLPGALLAVAQDAPEIKPEMVAAAARIAGVPLTPEAEKAIADGLNRRGGLLQNFQALRDMGLGNDTPSALVFNPVLAGTKLPAGKSFLKTTKTRVARPRTDEDLAFLPVTELAALLKKREIKSVDLTKLCLERLKKIRSRPALRRHADGGPGPRAGRAGRQGDRRREIPRAPPRRAVGGQGPAGRQGIQDDLRRVALQGPDDRQERDGLRAADGRRGGARRQARPWAPWPWATAGSAA